MTNLELRIPPVILVLVSIAIMWGLGMYMPVMSGFIPFSYELASMFVGLGALTTLAGVLSFRLARTTVDPRYPERATQLVVGGIYQRTRNPMYLGFLSALTGVAIYINSLTGFFVLPVFVWYMNTFQIKPEEKALTELFALTYTEYQQAVRRWI